MWCWNILDVVNNHVTSKQVQDLTLNATVLNILSISIYWVIVYVQMEAYLSTNVKLFVLVAFVMGDTSTWSSVTLVSRSPFLSKILYSFHLFSHSTLVGPHLTEEHLIMWVLYVTLTQVQTSYWWLELFCSETWSNRKIGTCGVIWII